MESEKIEHFVIKCRKCKHEARYHVKGQFDCIVADCNCKEIDPIEVVISGSK